MERTSCMYVRTENICMHISEKLYWYSCKTFVPAFFAGLPALDVEDFRRRLIISIYTEQWDKLNFVRRTFHRTRIRFYRICISNFWQMCHDFKIRRTSINIFSLSFWPSVCLSFQQSQIGFFFINDDLFRWAGWPQPFLLCEVKFTTLII